VSPRKAVKATITGRVQGVGFRYWTLREAEARGLDGWVRNRADGAVEAVFAGEEARVDDMLAACRRGPSFSKVAAVEVASLAEDQATGFKIRSW
jgi:acylphosphatase